MRVAIIDLGTNTFGLLIADIQGNKYKIIHDCREIVKLGQESITNNILSPTVLQRGVTALCNLSKIIQEYKVETIKAFATSAIREAENAKEFILEVKKQANIDIEIISGDKEAELIYYGNKMAVEISKEPCLIMDIGGGSNEFIIVNNTGVFWKQSFKLGVARLLSMFHPENPITEKTKQSIIDYLKVELQPLLNELKKHPVTTLVGSSGAFESVLNMIGKEEITENKTSYDISLEDYHLISKKTIHSTTEERQHMPGLIPMRRDMIVLSYILIDFILNNTEIKKITLSTYSLKEGAITLFMEKNQPI
ncbi:MAG TPA: exopolyphosphatase [Bacteroidia bacterium]|jgi:exopolyphosphatase/guanosine-5'-triphosphate,3'-diphosphate pyrophosphatase|nr:exopolyphosphatase [Bacteroidia bacterium]